MRRYSSLPHIRCPQNDLLLHASIDDAKRKRPNIEWDNNLIIVDCLQISIGRRNTGGHRISPLFRHTSTRRCLIRRGRPNIKLHCRKLDLDPALCCVDAQLVSPWTEQSIITSGASYYWARAAGAGASMDAPGVEFGRQQRCKWKRL